ncbi:MULTISPECIES: OsmC family protein [unclassified Duganella]|uniref:OsmC family protein n=1 Tax=unclassified Duganella TaxID=2636909 RepID=UPI0006F1C370|nr:MULTISPECIES: OsmC family protein [unclassified Duganella]KQV45904.1 osmotically inducible protein OsmC [Duganella sp. Root336D2]KRC03780.1 osmotically inducible protein OsmC [Duganella sp. Root198D2]
MKITAAVRSSANAHEATVATNGVSQVLQVPAKGSGTGSAVNGGEFLMLALATCYCNDVYREAGRLQIPVEAVFVEASADFSGRGLAATNVRYRARITSPAQDDVIADLLRQTDAVAEVHNTIRSGTSVTLD